MKISILASGSKGNTSLIEYKETKILIDIGISTALLNKKLKEIGVDIKEIDSVFITHDHGDHIKGLKTFSNKYQKDIFLSAKTNIPEEINKNLIKEYESNFSYKDFLIKTFKMSHDTEEVIGFVIIAGEKELAFITDTGYINNKYFQEFSNKDLYIFESNHDIRTLMKNKYPYYLKQRILSDKGHLSNKDASYYLSNFIGEKTKEVVLIHLSEENNTEELAKETLAQELLKTSKKEIKIKVAKQDEIIRVDL